MKPDLSLIGVGLYSPAEAAVLTKIPSPKIHRWLRGHAIGGKEYPRLWTSNLEKFDTESLYLSFLDLVQLRVADAFIREGLSPQKVRRAIEYGAEIVSSDYPFATASFRTDGKTVILHVLDEESGHDRLIDLFKNGQYLMQRVIEPSLRGLEFEGDIAARWWPLGRAKGIVIDPSGNSDSQSMTRPAYRPAFLRRPRKRRARPLKRLSCSWCRYGRSSVL